MSYEVSFVDLQEQPAAVVHGEVPHDGIASFLGPAFGEVTGAAADQHLPVVGPPIGRYRPLPDGSWDVEAGFPVGGPLAPEGRVLPTTLPGGRAARTVHTGAYAGVGAAYGAILDWFTEVGYVADGVPWETYLDAPDVPEPRTEVFVPCHHARPHETSGTDG